jgi:hypothetical protein
MRHYTAKPRIRLPCLPVGLTPGTTISSICIGFQPLLLNPHFDALINPLHELRCLTVAFNFSGCTAHLDIQPMSPCNGALPRLDPPFRQHGYLVHICHTTKYAPNDVLGRFCRDEHDVDVVDSLPWMCSSSGTNLTSWYYGQFANTLAALDILSLKDAKHLLVEFL